MLPDSLAGVIVPVVAATIILVGGAWVVRAYAGPAQAAYTSAIEGRMKVLMTERDEVSDSLHRLEEEVAVMRRTIADLEATVARLERRVHELTQENLELLRQQRAGRP